MLPNKDKLANRQAGTGDRRADWLVWGLLAALWLFHAAANFAWLKADTRPPYWDTAGHAITAIHISRSPFLADFAAGVQQWFTSSMHPPLMYWLSAPLAHLFWPTSDVFTGIHALFLAILLISTYAIAATYGGRKAGLLAAFIVSMYPLIYGLERHFLIDVPLVAMVALSNWLLIRSSSFERRGTSLACGLVLGLGMLTKLPFLLFAGGPFLVAALVAVASRSRRKLLNLSLAFLMAGLVAAPWYLANLNSTLAHFGQQPAWALAEGDPAIWSLTSWLYYARAFVIEQALLPLAAFFLLALAVWLARRRIRYETGFLLLGWLILPYIASSIYANKDPRYTMPYLTAVAVITALGLVKIKPPAVRVGLIALLILYALFQFLGLTWGLSRRLPDDLLPTKIAVPVGSGSLPVYTEAVHIASPPRAEDWQVQPILHDVLSLSKEEHGAQHLKLAVLADSPCFEQNVFKYYAIMDQMPIEVIVLTGIFEIADAKDRLLTSDYIITKTGDLGPAWSIQQSRQFRAELHDPSSELGQHARRIREYSLPDGSIAELYQHVP